jgi:hypothetical protein
VTPTLMTMSRPAARICSMRLVIYFSLSGRNVAV